MFRRPLAFAAVAALIASTAAASPGTVAALRGELQTQTQTHQDSSAQAAALREEIAGLQAQLLALQQTDATGERAVGDKKSRLTGLNAREAQLRAEMGANQVTLARLLGALELYRRSPPPALLVTPNSAKDAVRAQILIRAIEPELAARAAAFRAKADEMQRVRRAVDALSEDLFTSESALAEGRGHIETLIAQKTALERQLDADAVDAGARAEVLARQLRSLGASPLPLPAVPQAPPARLLSPVQGQLIRGFGQAGPDGVISQGVAWRTAAGAQVRAPAAGTVEYSGPLKGWGGVLIFNVGGGYHLVLAGLDRTVAAGGAAVTAGQVVATVTNGPSPELYLELRKDQTPLNPARWLAGSPPAAGLRR